MFKYQNRVPKYFPYQTPLINRVVGYPTVKPDDYCNPTVMDLLLFNKYGSTDPSCSYIVSYPLLLVLLIQGRRSHLEDLLITHSHM